MSGDDEDLRMKTPGFAEELIDDAAWATMLKVAGELYKTIIANTMRGGLDEFYARLVTHIEMQMCADEVARGCCVDKEYYEVIGARWVFEHIEEAPANFNREQFLAGVAERFKWHHEEKP